MKPLKREVFDVGQLMSQFPPVCESLRQRFVFELAGAISPAPGGQLHVARWSEAGHQEDVVGASTFRVEPRPFAYPKSAIEHEVHWHVSFADPQLAQTGDPSIVEQDALQTAEHPALGSLHEALAAQRQPLQAGTSALATSPITITGVERRCAITCPPGHLLSQASARELRSATRILTSPTASNILAMGALPQRFGRYRLSEIPAILKVAMTSFNAARVESRRLDAAVSRTVIHTGFWGCGIFRGNCMLMTILQALAADNVGVDLVFWAFDKAGARIARAGLTHYKSLASGRVSIPELMAELEADGYGWGFAEAN